MRSLEHGFEFNETARNIGFKDGDKILKFDGEEENRLYYEDVRAANLMRNICNSSEVTVLRDGKEVAVAVPEELGLLNMNKGGSFISPIIPSVIDSVAPNSAASSAGIALGDSIVSIDGKDAGTWNKLNKIMAELKSSQKQTFTVSVMRDSLVNLTATVDSTYKLGVTPKENIVPVHVDYGFFASFPAGVALGWDVLSGYVSAFQYVFSKEGAQSVGMFGSIGSLFPAAWDWHKFWMMTAFLSVILAFMNILPIPALDGGHAVFLIYEMVTGREPSEKFMERAQMAGMLIILGLFILAMYNDLMRFVF